jgi:hypothetical protein
MDERISVTEYKGKTIYVSDLSGLVGQDYLETIKRVIQRDANLPDGSLILQDITGSVVDQEVKDVVKQSMDTFKQKKLKVALLGVSGFKRVIVQLLNPIAYFAKSREDALEWLAGE